MTKIRLVDGTEYEIYNKSDTDTSLTIRILNADSTAMQTALTNKTNMAVIQYYVGTELIKAYADFVNLQGYRVYMNQTISIDYNTLDKTTASGFAETKANIFEAYITKTAAITTVATQTSANTEQIIDVAQTVAKTKADIDYIAMETGVSL